MKSTIRAGMGVAVMLGIGYAFYRETHPWGDRISRAELLALVPPEFREPPPGDPSAERRMREVVALADSKGPWRDRLRAILDAGPLHVSETEPPADRTARHRALGLYKDRFELLFQRSHDGSYGSRDPASPLLVMRFVAALENAGGDFEDAMALNAFDPGFALSTALRHSGPKNQRRCLATVPAESQTRGKLADAVVTDFRKHVWPRLARAATNPGDLEPIVHEVLTDGIDAGTFDARETTRLFIEAATLDAALCRADAPGAKATRDRLLGRIEAARLPAPTGGLFWRARYRWALNHHPNTLGRLWFLRRRHVELDWLTHGRHEAWKRPEDRPPEVS